MSARTWGFNSSLAHMSVEGRFLKKLIIPAIGIAALATIVYDTGIFKPEYSAPVIVLAWIIASTLLYNGLRNNKINNC